MRLAFLRDARAERRDIGEIDAPKMCDQPLTGKLPRQRLARPVQYVEKHDSRFLARKTAHDRRPNPGCATGDQNDFADKVWIDGGHGSFLPASFSLIG